MQGIDSRAASRSEGEDLFATARGVSPASNFSALVSESRASNPLLVKTSSQSPLESSMSQQNAGMAVPPSGNSVSTRLIRGEILRSCYI